MKIQSRILISVVSFQLVLLISFGVIIFHFSKEYVNNNFRKELEYRANIDKRFILENKLIPQDEYEDILKQYSENLNDEIIYNISYPYSNDSIFEKSKKLLPQVFIDELLHNKIAYYSDDSSLRIFGKEYTVTNKKYIVIISAKDTDGASLLKQLYNIIFTGILSISIVLLIVSFFLAKSILNPIKRKIYTAMKISSSNLHERITVENPNDEIGHLAIAFNRMLDRLEESFKLQSSFISNASHEIKNPLTMITGTAEIALLKDRSIDEYKQTLDSILQDSEYLNSLVNQLFLLAKTDANFEKLPKSKFSLIELLETISSQNKKLFNDKVKIIISKKSHTVSLYGNKDLLNSSIQNIIDNAIKFSNGKEVVIETLKVERRIEITITDNGPGVNDDEIMKITTAFYRSEKVRNINGHGIGLALTKKIIELHNGKITFENKKVTTGLKVIIILPIR